MIREFRVKPVNKNFSDESYENIALSMNAQNIHCRVVFG